MKKSALILLLLSSLSFSYGQETVFLETCGSIDVSTPKKVNAYAGWDNAAPVTFTRTTTLDGYADVRNTSSTTNHVWFPADKSSDLIISNIPAANYKNLKLSFDIAAYKLTDANVNKLILYCNDALLTLPSATFNTSKFITVPDISLPNSATITLKFEYTAENNTNGYRIDNFNITGERIASGINQPDANEFSLIICGNNLVLQNIPEGSTIEIYNSLGSIVQTSALNNGIVELNSNLTKGLYLVRIGNSTRKIIL